MANIYVRSTDGNDADNGSTWALAKATLAGAGAIDVAGDTVWISQVHAESRAGAITFDCAGTLTTPSRLLCGNDAAAPPSALATGASITTSGGTGTITLNGSFYCYGVTFICSSTLTLQGSSSNNCSSFEACSFQSVAEGSAGQIYLGGINNATIKTYLRNCTFKFDAAAERITVFGDCSIRGGSAVSGTTTPSSLFRMPTDRTAALLDCSGFDFSGFASTMNLIDASASVASSVAVFRNCKLPASWSGSLLNAEPSAPGQRYEMHNCDSGDTNYRLWVEDYAGSIKSETTIVRTGGASDGTTSLSWKMASSANAEYPLILLRSPEIVTWNETTGVSKTVTVEVLTDGVTLKDDECWLEVMYLGTSGYPLGSWISDAKADVLATAANQASSTAAWTTTGLTTPVKQKLSVTFTPQEKGPIVARVCLAKPSTTVYVDPLLTVS